MKSFYSAGCIFFNWFQFKPCLTFPSWFKIKIPSKSTSATWTTVSRKMNQLKITKPHQDLTNHQEQNRFTYTKQNHARQPKRTPHYKDHSSTYFPPLTNHVPLPICHQPLNPKTSNSQKYLYEWTPSNKIQNAYHKEWALKCFTSRKHSKSKAKNNIRE